MANAMDNPGIPAARRKRLRLFSLVHNVGQFLRDLGAKEGLQHGLHRWFRKLGPLSLAPRAVGVFNPRNVVIIHVLMRLSNAIPIGFQPY